MTKECLSCKKLLPVDSFFKDSNKKDGLQCYCKQCRSSKVRDWKKANPEAYKSINRKAQIKAKYGMSYADFDSFLNKQEHKCAICGTYNPNHISSQWRIDHCHNTGKVRGLLCSSCNLGLGHFKDSIEVLVSAINYLQNSNELHKSIRSSGSQEEAMVACSGSAW
jgi:hypothetical protein